MQTFRDLEAELTREGFIVQGDVIFNAGSSTQMAVNTLKVCALEVAKCMRLGVVCIS